MTIWRMRVSRCVPKATKTHSEYVILTAFPLQQYLHECASVSPYTCIACLVDTEFDIFDFLFGLTDWAFPAQIVCAFGSVWKTKIHLRHFVELYVDKSYYMVLVSWK